MSSSAKEVIAIWRRLVCRPARGIGAHVAGMGAGPAPAERRKDPVQGRWSMGVEVVNHQPDAFRRGNVLIDQQPHLLKKVLFGSL